MTGNPFDLIGMIENLIKTKEGLQYTNYPNDKGGPTKMGITLKSWQAYTKRPITADDIKKLTLADAIQFYKTEYYYHYNIDALPEELRPIVFDMAVNHGGGTAAKILQKALNGVSKSVPLHVDALIGDATSLVAYHLIKTLGSKTVINAIVTKRNEHYEQIVLNNPSQKQWLKGWLNRSESFRVN